MDQAFEANLAKVEAKVAVDPQKLKEWEERRKEGWAVWRRRRMRVASLKKDVGLAMKIGGTLGVGVLGSVANAIAHALKLTS